MAKRREEETFTVSDRRSFSSEGETLPAEERVQQHPSETVASQDIPHPESATVASIEASAAELTGLEHPSEHPPTDAPPPPSAAEQTAQADVYQRTNRSMDEALSKQMGAPSAADLEVTFERFLGSLYMTSLMHLGLAHEPNGQPRLDILSARQTIDTIGMLAEKTKGNLNSAEQNLLQNALYELRMAYLEVTNALARGPKPGAPSSLVG